MASLELQIADADAGERLDVVLARRVPGLSRASAKQLIADGEVRVNGRRPKKSQRLQQGDRIVLERLPGTKDFHARPDAELELPVLRETEEYVIVDKPAGMPSHPLREDELGTVANALVARYPEMREVGYRAREPGILHRLDTHTSGVLLAARTPVAFDRLRDLLRASAIEKRYLARCVGFVEAPQAIETPIANDPHNTKKVRACADPREIKRVNAQPARTEILSSEAAPLGSLVEARANHARRHQIRVHLASIGHPLVGDTLYGAPETEGIDHHLLHASSIEIDGVKVTSTWNHSVF
jgi:23S rRNA pseudouridine1911/1915/1917 synthase